MVIEKEGLRAPISVSETVVRPKKATKKSATILPSPISVAGVGKRTILLYDLAVSAGTGVYLDDEQTSEITIPDNEKTRIADFALRINGNSMQPKYHDGDIVLVEDTDSVEVGELGIFVLDGNGYFKQFGGDRLISLNSDYGDILLQGYSEVVCCGRVVGKLKKRVPTIFHNDGLVAKLTDYKLPSRYFGRAVAESDIGSGKIIGTDGAYDSTKGTLRAAAEFDYNDVHYFPGDALATSGTYVAVVGGLDATQVYIEDGDIVCKICTKLPPYMSAFEVGTSFFNAKSLTENHYLTFGHNTLAYLKNYPFITVKA